MILGLFAGYGATFIRDAPFAGIYLFFYEGCKTWANGKMEGMMVYTFWKLTYLRVG
jgi:hypothetical protein